MHNEQVQALSARLAEVEQQSPDYWTFRGRDERVGAHAIFHYPAMMVPRMQGAILDLIRDVAPGAKSILDPFVGSGTTLVEAMIRGLNFSGVDINPLAVLLSTVKATVVRPEELRRAATRIALRIGADRSNMYFVNFENQQKWFSKSASIALSRIARAISLEQNIQIRRVFWVVLARIVRTTCNSRTSTYKLHVRADADIARPAIDPVEQFSTQSKVVLTGLEIHYGILERAGSLRRGAYAGDISLDVGDILKQKTCKNAETVDVVITSPPYGDNTTTIPYGQYSYLPLMWIPFSDINDDLDRAVVANTHATDTASLGGSKHAALTRGEEACNYFPSYRRTMEQLGKHQDGKKRFAAFAADLSRSVQLLAKRTKPGGFHVWTVGERRICGIRTPMAQLLEEMLAAEGICLIHNASRRILSKSMAVRNTLSETMAAEQVLIARRS